MKIKNNAFDWAALFAPFVMCFVSAVLVLARWSEIPDQIGIHYTLDGTQDGTGSKKLLFVILGLAVAMVLLMCVISHHPSMWNIPVKITDNNSFIVYRLAKYMLEFDQLLISAMLCAFVLMSAFETKLPMWFWIGAIGALVVGNLVFIITIMVKGKQYE